MPDCICRTDPKTGKRWTNTNCREHGISSAADEPVADAFTALDNLMGRDQ